MTEEHSLSMEKFAEKLEHDINENIFSTAVRDSLKTPQKQLTLSKRMRTFLKTQQKSVVSLLSMLDNTIFQAMLPQRAEQLFSQWASEYYWIIFHRARGAILMKLRIRATNEANVGRSRRALSQP
ncbi:hypothetical protein V9T40_005344 [Parthenolecanium corni]|uniref:Uncharacterized protein n=1 Tax=Parthenolecanium corni TaxID=536013 RepID=A0AAN9TEZ2_9HEMI